MIDVTSMDMSDCPEYIRCSAPICPLDKDWHKRVYLTGEPVCLFLRETVKEGAAQRLGANEVFAELHRVSLQWLETEAQAAEKRGDAGLPRGRGDHFNAIKAAAKSGSTLDKREAASERMSAARKEKRQAGQPDS